MISHIYKAITVFCLLLVAGQAAGQNMMITRTDTTILEADSVFLSVEDYRGHVQWQSSADSLVWLDIAGANSDTLIVLVDSSAVYRAMITENSCDPVYSDSVYLFEDRKTTMAASVILLPEQQWQSSIDPTQSDSVEFVFDYSTNKLDTIQIGDFLFSDAEDGYVNKIVDLTKDTASNIITVTTAPSSILEIFSDLYVDHSDTLKNDPSVPYSLSKGVQLSPYGNKGLEVLHFDLNAVLHDLDGDLDTDNDQIRITGEYRLEPKINTEILIQDKALQRIYFEYEFKNTYDLNITIANGINTDDKFVKDLFKKPKKLAKIVVPTPIGIPLIFVPELQIEVGAELGIESEISAGIQHVSTSRTAMIYQNGYWRTEKSKTRETNPVLPSLENTKAYAKVFVKPEIAIKLYRFIGPYADLEVYGELDVAPFYDPWWQFYLGAKMGVGFKLEAFGISGFDFRADIFDYKYVIAHAETSGNIAPTAAISAEPSTGIPGTTFNFSAFGSSDPEDEISDLEVRWDWDNDGTWDTPYSGVKMASHTYDNVGTYTVKLQVMDKDGATAEDETTITVAETENTLPVALFKFSPGIPEPGEQIMFNASASYDPDGIDSELEYAWDWENDGELDTDFSKYQYAFHSYPDEGIYQVRLLVRDIEGETGTLASEVKVRHEKALIADYPLNGDASDESDFGNDGTIYGPTPASDRFGNENSALAFSGSNQYVSISHHPRLNSSELTISCWIYSNENISSPKGIIYKVNNTGSLEREFGLDAGDSQGNGIVYWETGDGSELHTLTSSTPIVANKWYHVVGVIKDNEYMKIYVDGNLENEISIDFVHSKNSNEIVIGKVSSNSQTTRYWNGKIDDIKLYNYELTESDISSLYSEGGWPEAQWSGSFIDLRDGNEYDWVMIGEQVWMAENLAYLPQVDPANSNSWDDWNPKYFVQGYMGDSVLEAKDTYNYKEYGVWYNHSAALSCCPEGWHTPANSEWSQLITYLNYSTSGGKLKEKGFLHWEEPNTGATNETGFTALPAGLGMTSSHTNKYGYFWTRSHSGYPAPHVGYSVRLSNTSSETEWYRDADMPGTYWARGLSVRCIRDE